jgi:hypothetical protein
MVPVAGKIQFRFLVLTRIVLQLQIFSSPKNQRRAKWVKRRQTLTIWIPASLATTTPSNAISANCRFGSPLEGLTKKASALLVSQCGNNTGEAAWLWEKATMTLKFSGELQFFR